MFSKFCNKFDFRTEAKRDEHQENCKLQQRNEVGPTLAREVRIRKVQEALKGQAA